MVLFCAPNAGFYESFSQADLTQSWLGFYASRGYDICTFNYRGNELSLHLTNIEVLANEILPCNWNIRLQSQLWCSQSDCREARRGMVVYRNGDNDHLQYPPPTILQPGRRDEVPTARAKPPISHSTWRVDRRYCTSYRSFSK